MQRGNKRNRQLDLWLGKPLLNMLATFRRRRSSPPAVVQTVGVICSPALGDTLLFSGPLQDLRVAFPKARIIHFCTKQNFAAAEIVPGADERILIDLTRPLDTVRRIRSRKVDVMVDFTSWQRLTALYTMLSKAKFAVGFRTVGQHRSRGYDRTVEHRADRHELENFRALLAGSGIVPPIASAHMPAIDVPAAVSPLFPAEPDVIAFHLWASGQRSWLREWPEDRWIELARRLARPETLFLITGAPTDSERTRPFVDRMNAAGVRAEAFVSPDGFRTLTQLLLRSRLVVSVNTGVMHLAAIAGAPTLAINGPNRNGRWGPVGPHAVGVEAPGEGCGYLHLGFDFDGRATDCMERTTVDVVFAAAEALLAQMPHGPEAD